MKELRLIAAILISVTIAVAITALSAAVIFANYKNPPGYPQSTTATDTNFPYGTFDRAPTTNNQQEPNQYPTQPTAPTYPSQPSGPTVPIYPQPPTYPPSYYPPGFSYYYGYPYGSYDGMGPWGGHE